MEPFTSPDSPMMISVVVMLITIAASIAAFLIPSFYRDNILHPYSIARGGRIHTLVTGNLIHADLMHLGFNMLSYYFFAFTLNKQVGNVNFLIIYIGSMLLADIPSLIKQRNNPQYFTLGASGAVSGIIFSSILFNPLSKFYLFILPIPISAYIFGPLYLLYCYYAAKRQGDNINHDAHMWGAIGGFLITVSLYPDILPYFFSAISSRW